MKDKWIRVSERLPVIGQFCLVYRPKAEESYDSEIKTGYYTQHKNMTISGNYQGFDCYCDVTHWQPIEPPEADHDTRTNQKGEEER